MLAHNRLHRAGFGSKLAKRKKKGVGQNARPHRKYRYGSFRGSGSEHNGAEFLHVARKIGQAAKNAGNLFNLFMHSRAALEIECSGSGVALFFQFRYQ